MLTKDLQVKIRSFTGVKVSVTYILKSKQGRPTPQKYMKLIFLVLLSKRLFFGVINFLSDTHDPTLLCFL